jgi:hypothetical protein
MKNPDRVFSNHLKLWAWNMILMSLLRLHLNGYGKTAWLSKAVAVGGMETWLLKAVAVGGMGGVGKNPVVETLDHGFDHLIWVTGSDKPMVPCGNIETFSSLKALGTDGNGLVAATLGTVPNLRSTATFPKWCFQERAMPRDRRSDEVDN